MALLLPNLICALILWRSGLGLLIGKFHQFLIICPQHDNAGVHVLLFQVFNLRSNKSNSKYSQTMVHACAN